MGNTGSIKINNDQTAITLTAANETTAGWLKTIKLNGHTGVRNGTEFSFTMPTSELNSQTTGYVYVYAVFSPGMDPLVEQQDFILKLDLSQVTTTAESNATSQSVAQSQSVAKSNAASKSAAQFQSVADSKSATDSKSNRQLADGDFSTTGTYMKDQTQEPSSMGRHLSSDIKLSIMVSKLNLRLQQRQKYLVT